MKSETLKGFCSVAFKEIDKYGLATIAFFYSGKGKTTPLSSKSIKKTPEKLKTIQCRRSTILEIRNIPEK